MANTYINVLKPVQHDFAQERRNPGVRERGRRVGAVAGIPKREVLRRDTG